jgi:hypothetical protein
LAVVDVVAPEVEWAAQHAVAHQPAGDRGLLVDAAVLEGAQLVADTDDDRTTVGDRHALGIGHGCDRSDSDPHQAAPIAPR